MDAIGYIRVSTEEQAREGVSIDSQRAKLEAWAVANDAELVDVLVDAGLSGGRADNRPGLQMALDRACRGKLPLVVYSLSRLARSTKDTLAIAERLDKAGADLVSLSEKIDTTSAAGKMVFRLLAVLSEFERDLVAERTAAALQHMKGKLEAYNHAPFGFEREGRRLAPIPTELAVVQRMQEWRRQGWSLRKIGERLTAEGIATKSGGRWHACTVRNVLNNSIYAAGAPDAVAAKERPLAGGIGAAP